MSNPHRDEAELLAEGQATYSRAMGDCPEGHIAQGAAAIVYALLYIGDQIGRASDRVCGKLDRIEDLVFRK